MRLYFLRHGQAASHASDALRELTERGRQQVLASAAHVASVMTQPAQVFVSPYRRAQQTMELFCRASGFTLSAQTVDWLLPEAAPQVVERELATCHGDILLVSHQPLANYLLDYLHADSQPLPFMDTAHIACLQAEAVCRGLMSVRWFADPDGLRHWD